MTWNVSKTLYGQLIHNALKNYLLFQKFIIFFSVFSSKKYSGISLKRTPLLSHWRCPLYWDSFHWNLACTYLSVPRTTVRIIELVALERPSYRAVRFGPCPSLRNSTVYTTSFNPEVSYHELAFNFSQAHILKTEARIDWTGKLHTSEKQEPLENYKNLPAFFQYQREDRTDCISVAYWTLNNNFFFL